MAPLQVVPLCVEALGTANVIGEVEWWNVFFTQLCPFLQYFFCSHRIHVYGIFPYVYGIFPYIYHILVPNVG